MKPEEIVTKILLTLKKTAQVGSTGIELDRIAEEIIKAEGAESYNKGYKPEWSTVPYPATICVGINDIIAHGIPTDRPFQDGDTVSFDIGIKKDGICADAGFTMGIGTISKHDGRLIVCARRALYAGIEKVKAGATIYEIANAMESTAIKGGFVTNKNLTGHGIGVDMHESPRIPAFTYTGGLETQEVLKKELDYVLKVGDRICLEPFLTDKDRYGVKSVIDGWTIRTRDERKSAFFEHMLEVTVAGCKILTDHIDPNEIIY